MPAQSHGDRDPHDPGTIHAAGGRTDGAGVPTGPPEGGGARRRVRLFGQLAALLLIAGVVGYFLVDTGVGQEPEPQVPDTENDQDPAPEPETAPDPQAPGDPGAAAEPGNEATVAVVDSGFSVLATPAGEPIVSWGLVLENTGEEAAVTASVQIDIVDDDGDSLIPESYEQDQNMAELLRPGVNDLLEPGQHTGLGDFVLLTDADVAEVEFEVVDVEWWEPGSGPDVEDLAVTAVTATSGDDELELEFTVDSEHPRDVDSPTVQAVFHNEDGEIVGGSRSLDLAGDYAFAQGESEHRAVIRDGLPPDLDPGDVQLYAYSSRL
ncbi:hypothetical protein RIF23_11185 [Lipingzhangella sp. LS1_29]|uniref:DUF4352 domain-containing protein n=1 Tax=Lipingzhangella rawalii TaxID=2055835 RepID=A0ABU2H6F0_9ACTN|nr:hypothetical protein [Lipingzhangella rawalii]MDS1270865.1 hypothetical protein [Lipingzhangella rawalii]